MSDDAEKGFLSDETGSRSTARALLWLSVVSAIALIWTDTFGGESFEVPGEAYALLGTMIGAFTVWAAGPRIAQHLSPALGAMVGAIGTAAAARKNKRRDPELGIEVTK